MFTQIFAPTATATGEGAIVGAEERASEATTGPAISVEGWMAAQAGHGKGGHRFEVHRRLGSGRLAPAVLLMAGRRVLVGVEAAGRPGHVCRVDERDIRHLAKVTRRKGVEHNLKMHWEASGEESPDWTTLELFSTQSSEIVAVLEAMVHAVR
jgi:hypothetical protein